MYHQNWLEEMDQIGCCNNGSTTATSTSRSNKNNSSCSNEFSSSSITTAAATITMNKRSRIRIRNKGGGSWRSYTSSNNDSSVFTLFWLIVSVGSSVAVMAYQNDLSVISSSSRSSSSISGTSKSISANSRHGCVWSRTDSSTATTTTTTTTASSSLNNMNGMYAGNDPFHHQQQPNFPALSSSSSVSPYSSLLTSAFTGGSSSTSGGGSGVLTLNCNVRTLNTDFQNYTAAFTREQVEQARAARVQCNDKLFFESILSPNQTLFQLTYLKELQIDRCKMRKVPKAVFASLTQLQRLDIRTDNAHWSSSVGLEIESGAFNGLGQLESLDLSRNNIYLFPDANVLCPMRNLLKLNMSRNSLSDLESSSSSSGSCVMNIQNLDLSHNTIRRLRNNGFSRLNRLSALHLQFNYLEELEDESFHGLGQLRLLNLSSNRLVALPPSIFTSSGNSNLRELYLQNNSISALSPQIFSNLDQLLLLDLSMNSLSSQWIKGHIFSSLYRLVVLKLSFNSLHSIDSAIFQDLTSLQVLLLNNNEIESIHPEAFKNLRNLNTLYLSHNRLKSLDGHFSNLFVLRQLYLDSNTIHHIGENSLKNCTSLQDLGLSDNRLTEVSAAVSGLTQLQALDIGQNLISSINMSGLGSLYGLRIVDNDITELPTGFCQSMKNLRVLNLAQNRINKIASGAFSDCPELKALRLDANLLQALPNLAQQLPNLLWLNVSVNSIQRIDYSLLPPALEWLDGSSNLLESLTPVSDGGNLRVMDLSHNRLTFLPAIPPTLESLRVNHNNIKEVIPDTFIRSSRLRRVELIGNKLEHLPLSALRLPPVSQGKSLPEFFLAGNQFLCSCEMEWLTRVTQLAVLRQYPRFADLGAIVCRPTFIRSNQLIPLVEATPKDFLCPYKSHCFSLCQCCEFDACDCEMTCPTNCLCHHDTAWSSNIVQCSHSNFSQIPPKIPMDATELYLDGNEFPTLGNHIFIGKKNLRILYMNNSGIETISGNKTFKNLKALEVLRLDFNHLTTLNGSEFAYLQSLKELYLNNNRLRYISQDSFARLSFLQVLRIDNNFLVDFNVWQFTKTNGYLSSVMLAHNPWSCDCEFLVPFRNWIDSFKNTDFALAKCQPTEEQLQQQQQQDGNSNNSSAIMNSGGSTITLPTISSMCAPLTQKSFNYNNHDNPALLPSAASASSSNGGLTNNHISSLGGAARSNLGSLQLSGPYHHAHLENQAGNFPQNENIIATTDVVGGGLRHKTGHNDEEDDSSGFSTFSTLLVVAIILISFMAFLVGFLTFRKRQRESESFWCQCFSKCGINGNSSALAKCLQNSSSANEDGVTRGVNSGDMDYYYYSDEGKLFDAYLIYSKADEDFVTNKLTFELEKAGSRKLRLCLHHRDLCVASNNPWTEIVLSACEASRKVVIINSANFLNEWSNNHFRTSVQSAINQQHSKKVIVIQVNDQNVSNICGGGGSNAGSYPPSSSTNLEWGDKNFWQKFRLLLSTPQVPSTGNNNRHDITTGNFPTISSHSQLPYTTNLNQNGINFVSAPVNNGPVLPYQIPMIPSHHHHYHQPSDPVSAAPPHLLQQQPHFISMMHCSGQQQHHQGIPSLPLNHSSSVHPVPSQVTPLHFGYSNIDDGFQNNMSSQQTILFFQQQQQQQPLHFSSSNNNNRQLHNRQQSQHQSNQAHPYHNNHVHTLSQLSNMSSNKSPVVEANYSSSAVSSVNEEFDHVYSTLDSPLESPCSDLGPGHVAGQFEGAMISGAQRHRIQHSTSSGISSGSDATSGTGGCHPGGTGSGGGAGPPMYFV